MFSATEQEKEKNWLFLTNDWLHHHIETTTGLDSNLTGPN
jgi:hypothetical protein